MIDAHWHCDHCGQKEPARKPYKLGDHEPCSDCGKGVSRVMSLKAGAAMEQLRALGWTPPKHYSSDDDDDEPVSAAEIGQFQDDVRALLLKQLADRGIYEDIDGGGCDSGDWRDFTLSEIEQGFNRLADHFFELEEARAKPSAPAASPEAMEVDDAMVDRALIASERVPYGKTQQCRMRAALTAALKGKK